MTDKMREAFEKWAKMRVPYRALKELDDEGEYDDHEVRMMWRAWQAAQAEAVPVVGEPVAYGVPNSRPTESLPFMQVMLQIPANAQYPELLVPLIVKPTHSITAAELDRLQEGEACAETVLEAALVKFPDAPTEFECIGKMAAEVVRRYDAELERLRKDAELKASEASIGCKALQEIIDLLPGSSVEQAKLIAVAAMTKRAAIAAEGEKECQT